jgi:HK97 family phage major capsid protein/HK97 family phage prohead protease
MEQRAYSILHVKSLSDEERVIRGVATTPEVDRMGDVVEPLGVRFKNPMPLLHQHDARLPVGTVEFDAPTEKGITFTARLPKIEEPGALRDRIETAWGEIKAGLIRGVSIGFRPLEDAVELLRSGGPRFLKTEVLELSLVTVPAHAGAGIREIKQFDEGAPAATGREALLAKAKPPGATGIPDSKQKGSRPVATIAEQIAAFEAKRQAKAARMSEIMQKAADEGATLDAAQEEEYDGLAAEVASIDKHLSRLAVQEKMAAATARPVAAVSTAAAASEARSGIQVVARKEAPGIEFARVVKCIGKAQGNRREAAEMAREIYGSDSAVAVTLKAAVSAGNTGTGWAANLTGAETAVYADFVEFLRPQTILGRFGQGGIPALRRVPFRTPLIGQTAGGEGYWVGEGAAKPLTAFDFSRTTLEPLKVANIAVVTMETLNNSSPAADQIIRDQLAAALRQRLDTDFIDPAKAAVAGISPASVTNGATAIPASGTDADAVRADVRALFATFIAANNAPTTGVWIMSATTALALSMMTNPLGQPEFPGLGMNGGVFQGLPALVSEYAGDMLALVNASDIYLGDDGGIRVDMSREASLEMSNTPTGSSVTPTASTLVSLWQTNSVGFLAEREINWARRRPGAVAYLTGVAYGTTAPATP